MIEEMKRSLSSYREHKQRGRAFARELAQQIVDKRDHSSTVKLYVDIHSWQTAVVLAQALGLTTAGLVSKCNQGHRAYGMTIEKTSNSEGRGYLYRIKLDKGQWTRLEHMAHLLGVSQEEVKRIVRCRETTACGRWIDIRKAQEPASRFMSHEYRLRHLPTRRDRWRYAYELAEDAGVDVKAFRRMVERAGQVKGWRYERQEQQDNSAVRYLYRRVR